MNYAHILSLFVKQRNTFTINRMAELQKERRCSDAAFMTFKDNPSIFINKVNKENLDVEFNLRSNFSEVAQDGCIEIIQALTEKILGSSDHIELDDNSCNL